MFSRGGGNNEEEKWRLWVDELRKWVRLCVSRQPVWQVTVFGDHWFCPYCGKIRVVAKPGEEMIQQIADVHLANDCDPFDDIGQPPIFPLKELQRRALHFFVKKNITSNPAWQVRDRSNRWVNPYSTHPTDIVLGSKIDKTVLNLIVEHLQKDPELEKRGWDGFRSVEQIRQAVAKRATMEKVVSKLTRLVKEQDVWKVLTPSGAWICPYCRKVVETIVVRTPIDIEVNLPRMIADHLQGGCDGYKNKVAPATDALRLSNEALGVNPTATTTASPVNQRQGVPEMARPQQPGGAGPRPSVTQVDLGRITQVMMGEEAALAEQSAKIEKELQLAREKQRRMLPSELPKIENLSFAVHYEPCDELGGDFYDFIELGQGKLGISIGDVTGHGVNAALVMGMCKKVMNLVAKFEFSPAKSLSLANEEIIKDLDGQTFVSMWYGILDPATGHLRYARAGHEPLMLYNVNRTPKHQHFKPRGMAVGLISGDKFEKLTEEAELQLIPGDLLILYTDGIPELQNPEGDQFGREGIEACVEKSAASPTPEGAIQALLSGAKDFARGVPVDDDLTILAWRFK